MKRMNKRIVAIILEVIPIVSAIINYILIVWEGYNSLDVMIPFTTIVSLFGIAFFFVGRKLDNENVLVKILGILDWLATFSIIGIYIIVIIIFAW